MKCETCPLRADPVPCYAESIANARLCELASTREDYRGLVLEKSRNPPEVAPAPRFPGLLEQAANLAGAVTGHVANGLKHASEEAQQSRLEICKSCPEYDAPSDRCRKCGCGPLKRVWESSRCPLDKW